MLKAVVVGCFSVIGFAGQSAVHGAIYQQDFEGYTSGQGIGTLNNSGGTGSTEQVTGTAARAGILGWEFFARNNNSARFRAYDDLGTVLTQADSFELSFWIRNYQRGNSGQNVGFVGLFDSQSSVGSTNGLPSMKHFIGLNLGGVDTAGTRHPAYIFAVDTVGAGFTQAATDADIIGGFQQWYNVKLAYDATTRQFTYGVDDGSTTYVTSGYTLPVNATFRVDAFGGSNGTANDGRSMGVHVDDISLVPEPAAVAMMASGALLGLARRRG